MKQRRARALPLASLFFAFCAGMVVMWVLQHYGPPRPAIKDTVLTPDTTAHRKPDTAVRPQPDTTADATPRIGAPPPPIVRPADAAIATSGDIPRGHLRPPVDGNDPETWKGGFSEKRGSRPHEAVDILAPRNTPVYAVDDGAVAKLFNSKAGGLTVYQFDPDGRLCYYYAHLERYADGLHDGQAITKGQLIGYVGTSGNAPPNTPHLHFAVFHVNADRRWWDGTAVDPYEVFHR